MYKKSYWTLSIHFFLTLFIITSLVNIKPAGSQNTQVVPPSSDSNEPKFPKSDYGYDINQKKVKYLSLYMGIFQDVKIGSNPMGDHLPSGVKFSGDFRRYTSLQVSPDNKTLRFTPKRVGLSTLIIKHKNKPIYEYRIDVRKNDITKVAHEVKSLLSDIEGIEIKIINNRVVVDGYVILPKELNRIYQVISQYPETLTTSLVSLSPLAQKKIAEIMERNINNPDVHIKAINEKFIIEGVVSSDKEKERIFLIVETYLPDLVNNIDPASGVTKLKSAPFIDLVDVVRAQPKPDPPKKTIQIAVHYVEMKKTYLKGFNFDWSPSFQNESNISFVQDSRGAGGAATTIAGIVSNLLPKLNRAKEHGFARILKSASIITTEDQAGSINATTTTQFVLPGTTSPSTAVSGITINITPKVEPQTNKISLQATFTINATIPGTGGSMSTRSNTITTTISIRSGKSAAVGGIVTQDSATDYNKPVNQGDNPLFRLLSSKAFQKGQSQFVVFLTPIIKPNASTGTEKVKRKFRLKY